MQRATPGSLALHLKDGGATKPELLCDQDDEVDDAENQLHVLQCQHHP